MYSYLGALSENQTEVFGAFKAWIHEKGWDNNPWFTDTFLLRFCRARQFDLEAIKLMYGEFINYRDEYKVDTIMQDFVMPKKEEVFGFYPRGYCGVDKIGRPVYYERNGSMKPHKVMELVTEADIKNNYIFSYEFLVKYVFLAASAA